jgi:SAM-dependent methyltransferase
MKSTARFSDRVANYVKFRPGYPSALLSLLENETGFDQQKDIADIGSGTGLLSKLFLGNDNLVYGVEPNDEMRNAAEKLLDDFINFVSINGTAENTALADESVDLITSGQAFHWFDSGRAKLEFMRILKPGGYVVLIWNERVKSDSPVMEGYEKLLLKHGTDYLKVKHENLTNKDFNKFYGVKNFKLARLDNYQIFDYAGLKGRLLSSSYISPDNKKMIAELKNLFDKTNKGGKIKFEYETKVYYGKIKK